MFVKHDGTTPLSGDLCNGGIWTKITNMATQDHDVHLGVESPHFKPLHSFCADGCSREGYYCTEPEGI